MPANLSFDLKMDRRLRDKIIGRILGSLLLFVVPLVSAQTKSQPIEPEPSRDRPLLEIDLRKYGYEPHGNGARMEPLSLAFTQSNDLLVAWTTTDESQSKKEIRSTTPIPSHLHGLIVDPRTGQKERGGEWPSRYLHASITPVGKDMFLICARDEIQLLSHDFVTVQDQVLSPPNTCQGMRISPNRHSFSTRTGTEYNLIDAESFQPVAEWSSKEAIDVHFTDSLLVGVCRPDIGLCIRRFDQDWQPLRAVGVLQRPQALGHQGTAFVNDSTLAIANAGEMTVVTLEGAMLFRVNLPKKFSFARIATSTDGNRFAYIETKLRGSKALDMYSNLDDHVVVYDLGPKTAVYARKVNGGSLWIPPFEHRNQIALSSDGALLAILDNGILEVYSLPAPKD